MIVNNKKFSKEFGAIILAGGASSRMGFCKSKIKMGGEYLLASNIETIRPYFKDVSLVVSKENSFFRSLPLRKLVNPYHPSCGPITGLLVGMKENIDNPFSFVMACDMPFVNLGIINRLMEIAKEGADVVIPHSPDGYEPLFAMYSRRCLPVFERMVRNSEFRIQKMFPHLNVKYLSTNEVMRLDPGGKAFFNINNKEDLEKAENLSRVVDRVSCGM